tara:strand:- start:182 stop:580 length:399 start_codon:yes stop_codon:yes gene_type:complete
LIEAAALSEFFEGRRIGEGKYLSLCPLCSSKSETLYLTDGRKGTLIYCHSGCDKEDVLAEVGLKLQDLFSNSHTFVKPPYDPAEDLHRVDIIRSFIKEKKEKGEPIRESDVVFANSVKARLKSHNCWKPLNV